MTETTNAKPEPTIAEIVREGRKPTGELFQLANQAARLGRAIKVAEKWIDAATTPDVPGEMLGKAETLHDELEEELARVTFRMEVIRAKQAEKAVNEERPEEERVEDVDGIAHAAQLADSLMQVYCVLAAAPVDIFGIEGSEATPQGRYSLMGALLAAKDVADEELEGLVLESK